MPQVLKFLSEYEMVMGSSPNVDPGVIIHSEERALFEQFERDIVKNYELKPVIVILENHQREIVINMMRHNKFKFVDKCDEAALEDIRSWDYGVLLLKPEEGRGVDNHFKVDAHVMVLARVSTYHELQQMVGRSSRSRGVCNGTLYLVGEEKAVHLMDKLRKHGFSNIQDKEKLLLVLEKKSKD